MHKYPLIIKNIGVFQNESLGDRVVMIEGVGFEIWKKFKLVFRGN